MEDNKLVPQTVYIPIGVEGSLFKLVSENNNEYWVSTNIKLEKKKQQIVMSIDEFENIACEIWDAAFEKSGENMIDHIIEISNPAPDKETYIDNLFSIK